MESRVHEGDLDDVYSLRYRIVNTNLFGGSYQLLSCRRPLAGQANRGYVSPDGYKCGARETITFFNLDKDTCIYYMKPDGSIGTAYQEDAYIEPGISDPSGTTNINNEVARLRSEGGVLIWIQGDSSGYYASKIYDEEVKKAFAPLLVSSQTKGEYLIHLSRELLNSNWKGVYIKELCMSVGYRKDLLENPGITRQGLGLKGSMGAEGFYFVLDTLSTFQGSLWYRSFDGVTYVEANNAENPSHTIKVFHFNNNRKAKLVKTVPIAEAVASGISWEADGRTYRTFFFESFTSCTNWKSDEEVAFQKQIDSLMEKLEKERAASDAELRDLKLKLEQEKLKVVKEAQKGQEEKSSKWGKFWKFVIDYCLKPIWAVIKAIIFFFTGIIL